MYLVVERDETKDMTNISKGKKLKMILMNVWILFIISVDLISVKKQAFQQGRVGHIQLTFIMAYFIASQAYGFYCFNQTKNKLNAKLSKIKQKQISIGATIFWHFSSLFKLVLIGLSLSSNGNMYIQTYFLIRLTVYSSTLVIILSHLKIISSFVLYKGELMSVFHKHGEWMLGKFWIVFYCGIIGINLDVIAFGNQINYYVWLVLMCIFILYLIDKLIIECKIKSSLFKNIFQSE